MSDNHDATLMSGRDKLFECLQNVIIDFFVRDHHDNDVDEGVEARLMEVTNVAKRAKEAYDPALGTFELSSLVRNYARIQFIQRCKGVVEGRPKLDLTLLHQDFFDMFSPASQEHSFHFLVGGLLFQFE